VESALRERHKQGTKPTRTRRYVRTIGSHGIGYQFNGNNEWWWLLLHSLWLLLLLLGATAATTTAEGATVGRHHLCGPIQASLDTAAVVMVHPTSTTNVEVVAVVEQQTTVPHRLALLSILHCAYWFEYRYVKN
jgi:hypothetical protein